VFAILQVRNRWTETQQKCTFDQAISSFLQESDLCSIAVPGLFSGSLVHL
jgi:hypothetical protein